MRCRHAASARWLGIWTASLSCCLLFSGCLVPASRVATYREQYQRLCEKNKSLEARVANLDAHSRELEEQLTGAEFELESVDRLGRADRHRLRNFQHERDQLYHKFGQGGIPSIVNDRLAELAQRYPGLNYDAETGVAKLDADILFDTAEVELRPGAQELLTEFAAILRTPEAQELRIMAVGHTDDRKVEGADVRDLYPNNWHLGAARSLAVTDFLRVRGVNENRMGMASYGRYQPIVSNSSEPNRQRNRRVELFLIASDVPVVGWTETLPSVYR